MKKFSLLVLLGFTCVSAHAAIATTQSSNNSLVNSSFAHKFWAGIQSNYAYDDVLLSQDARPHEMVDTNSWSNLILLGYAPFQSFQPYVGIGAFKIRLVDDIPPSETSFVTSGNAQANVITKPAVAWKIGARGLIPLFHLNDLFLGYDVSDEFTEPEISYAVIRGSIGANEPINLRYNTFVAEVDANVQVEDGHFYVGPSFINTHGHYSKSFIVLSNNNIYDLSSFESQHAHAVGAVAGATFSPGDGWNIDLKTRFYNIYDVTLELTHAL